MSAMLGLSLVCLLASLCGWLAVWYLACLAPRRPRPDMAALRAERDSPGQVVFQPGETGVAAKTRILANITHEVRTPLAGILGLADLLAATRLSAEQAAYVEAIQNSGEALGSLIDEILDFSRIEAGKLELALTPVDPVALMESVVELMAPAAHAKNLEIAALADSDLPGLILADASRLRQILFNLVGNAVKFTEVGGVGITLSHRNGCIEFSVRDTGPGVPHHRRSAIFDEFEQAGGSSPQKPGGTGLGLAIARRLAGAMGGQLELLASTPAGSEFRLLLPPHEAITNVAVKPAKPAAGSKGAALVVAKSVFESAYLCNQLQSLGFSAHAATSLDAARVRLGEQPVPALMISDCALGLSIARSLAGLATRAGVGKILILFSPGERRAFGQTLTDGYSGWLVKPVRSQSLRRLASNGPQEAAAALSRQALPMHPGLHVLLAEDNDINALVASHQLQRLGARVSRACDGPTALALASRAILGETAAFDLIVLDLRMPGLDGREVARAIRQIELESAAGRVQIIALTASAGATDREACHRSGIDHVLTKPLDITLLSQILTGQVNLQRSA